MTHELAFYKPMDSGLEVTLGGCGLQCHRFDLPEDVSERPHALFAADIRNGLPGEVTDCRHEEGQREAF